MTSNASKSPTLNKYLAFESPSAGIQTQAISHTGWKTIPQVPWQSWSKNDIPAALVPSNYLLFAHHQLIQISKHPSTKYSCQWWASTNICPDQLSLAQNNMEAETSWASTLKLVEFSILKKLTCHLQNGTTCENSGISSSAEVYQVYLVIEKPFFECNANGYTHRDPTQWMDYLWIFWPNLTSPSPLPISGTRKNMLRVTQLSWTFSTKATLSILY